MYERDIIVNNIDLYKYFNMDIIYKYSEPNSYPYVIEDMVLVICYLQMNGLQSVKSTR